MSHSVTANKCFMILNYFIFYVVMCPSLTAPDNGVVGCGEVPIFGDVCSYQCNGDYEISGSRTRTCQSDGTWSGREPTCVICKEIVCLILVIVLLYSSLTVIVTHVLR